MRKAVIHKLRCLFLACCLSITAIGIGYGNTGYTIRKIQVVGNAVDPALWIRLAGLQVGDTITPNGEPIRYAIREIAKHAIVKSVEISLADIDEAEGCATLIIQVTEHPRLANCIIEGIPKKEQRKLLEKVPIPSDMSLSPYMLHKTVAAMEQYFLAQGFRGVRVTTICTEATEGKAVLKIAIYKGPKHTVHKITFEGNHHLSSPLLIYQMKTLNEAPRLTLIKDVFQRIITLEPFRKGGILLAFPQTLEAVMCYLSTHVSLFPSVFNEENYLKAKEHLIGFYQSKGFRDMRIVTEGLRCSTNGKLHISLKLEEGAPYTIRHIKWAGNYVYNDQQLNDFLNLTTGDVYDPAYVNSRLQRGLSERTIGDLYYNNGYFLFQAEVVEVGLEDHQVDLEIRLYEGKQTTINQIHIVGNTLTHEAVIRRALETLPGEKFNMDLVTQSLANLSMLKLFKSEKLNTSFRPDTTKNTVDITYKVEEQPNLNIGARSNFSSLKDFELGLVFGCNNVSIKKLFMWKRPVGDGQYLAVEWMHMNKDAANRFRIDFKEPWLWLGNGYYMFELGMHSMSIPEKNDAMDDLRDLLVTTALYPLARTHKTSSINCRGASISLGKRFKHYWQGHLGLTYDYYRYERCLLLRDHKRRSGILHNFNVNLTCYHNSLNHSYFPTKGWEWSNVLTLTPPYNLWSTPTSSSSIPSYAEFWKFTTGFSLVRPLVGNLVWYIHTFLGLVWHPFKTCPFERFFINDKGNDRGNRLLNSEKPMLLRGYPSNSEDLTPMNYEKGVQGGVLVQKFTAELRYPLARTPVCLYLLGFIEMGNSWLHYTHYSLLDMKKSVGGGIRLKLPPVIPIPLPMICLDIGYPLDSISNLSKKTMHYRCSMEWNISGDPT